jgi:hypothetical protein
MVVKSEVLAILKQEPQWKQYEEELLEVSEIQGVARVGIETEGRSRPIPTTGPTAPEPKRTSRNLEQRFPNRARWLRDRLRERGWSTNKPSGFGGPDHKTIKRILEGQPVQDGTIDKLLVALNQVDKLGKLRAEHVPPD